MSSTADAPRGRARLEVEVAGRSRQVTIEPAEGGRLALSWDDQTRLVDVTRLASGGLSLVLVDRGHASYEITGHETAPGELLVGLNGRQVQARVADRRRRKSAAAAQVEGEAPVTAPMPGKVVRVLAEAGDVVAAGQGLAVVEAMKMENEVASPAAGVVSDVRVSDGDSVDAGAVLLVVRVDAEGDD